MITELTNYEMFQLEHYGNILPELVIMPDGSCENGIDEQNRSAEWVHLQSEIQLEQYQNQ